MIIYSTVAHAVDRQNVLVFYVISQPRKIPVEPRSLFYKDAKKMTADTPVSPVSDQPDGIRN